GSSPVAALTGVAPGSGTTPVASAVDPAATLGTGSAPSAVAAGGASPVALDAILAGRRAIAPAEAATATSAMPIAVRLCDFGVGSASGSDSTLLPDCGRRRLPSSDAGASTGLAVRRLAGGRSRERSAASLAEAP